MKKLIAIVITFIFIFGETGYCLRVPMYFGRKNRGNTSAKFPHRTREIKELDPAEPDWLGPLKDTDWLGLALQMLIKPHTPVINISGTVEFNFATPKAGIFKRISNATEELKRLKDVKDDDYVYVTVSDVWPSRYPELPHTYRWRFLIAKKSKLLGNINLNGGILNTAESIDIYGNDFNDDKGDILFYFEFFLISRDNIFIDNVALHKSLRNQHLIRQPFMAISNFIKERFPGPSITACIGDVKIEHLFKEAFPNAQPMREYSGKPERENPHIYTARIDEPDVNTSTQFNVDDKAWMVIDGRPKQVIIIAKGTGDYSVRQETAQFGPVRPESLFQTRELAEESLRYIQAPTRIEMGDILISPEGRLWRVKALKRSRTTSMQFDTETQRTIKAATEYSLTYEVTELNPDFSEKQQPGLEEDRTIFFEEFTHHDILGWQRIPIATAIQETGGTVRKAASSI